MTQSTAHKQTISYPEELEEIVDQQVDAGIAESKSEWFRDAAYIRLSMQGLAEEAQGRRILRNAVEEGDVSPDILGGGEI